MFDTIVLLSGPAEQAAFPALFNKYNAGLTVVPAQTLADLDAIEPRVLRRARLVAVLTSVIVPPRILDRLGYGAYNFHPGPPDYPGRLPSHFAVYDRAKAFGVTAHAMAAAVDSGPIVGVDLFDIPPGIGVPALEKLAFGAAARLIWRLAEALATARGPLPELPIRWCGRKSTKRMYEAMCELPPDISGEELARRLHAFGDGHLGVHPTMMVNGQRIRYAPPETAAPSVVPAQSPQAEPVG